MEAKKNNDKVGRKYNKGTVAANCNLPGWQRVDVFDFFCGEQSDAINYVEVLLANQEEPLGRVQALDPSTAVHGADLGRVARLLANIS